MNDIIETYEAVLARIAAAAQRSGRLPDEVQVIAVTKTFGPEVVTDALDAGLTVFGENKVQEAAWKIPLCPARGQWHLIGHLQRNKVRQAVRLFSTIHSIDSTRLLETVAAAAEESGDRPEIYLEVNVSGEPSKFGLIPEAVDAIVEQAMGLPQLTLTGLMTMAPFTLEPEETRPCFARLRELRERLEVAFGISLPHLSMGMSNDFEVAVEEGATDVRIGTALFGQRPKWKPGQAESDVIYD